MKVLKMGKFVMDRGQQLDDCWNTIKHGSSGYAYMVVANVPIQYIGGNSPILYIGRSRLNPDPYAGVRGLEFHGIPAWLCDPSPDKTWPNLKRSEGVHADLRERLVKSAVEMDLFIIPCQGADVGPEELEGALLRAFADEHGELPKLNINRNSQVCPREVEERAKHVIESFATKS